VALVWGCRLQCFEHLILCHVEILALFKFTKTKTKEWKYEKRRRGSKWDIISSTDNIKWLIMYLGENQAQRKPIGIYNHLFV
jgi:hypothetical protein